MGPNGRTACIVGMLLLAMGIAQAATHLRGQEPAVQQHHSHQLGSRQQQQLQGQAGRRMHAQQQLHSRFAGSVSGSLQQQRQPQADFQQQPTISDTKQRMQEGAYVIEYKATTQFALFNAEATFSDALDTCLRNAMRMAGEDWHDFAVVADLCSGSHGKPGGCWLSAPPSCAYVMGGALLPGPCEALRGVVCVDRAPEPRPVRHPYSDVPLTPEEDHLSLYDRYFIDYLGAPQLTDSDPDAQEPYSDDYLDYDPNRATRGGPNHLILAGTQLPGSDAQRGSGGSGKTAWEPEYDDYQLAGALHEQGGSSSTSSGTSAVWEPEYDDYEFAGAVHEYPRHTSSSVAVEFGAAATTAAGTAASAVDSSAAHLTQQQSTAAQADAAVQAISQPSATTAAASDDTTARADPVPLPANAYGDSDYDYEAAYSLESIRAAFGASSLTSAHASQQESVVAKAARWYQSLASLLGLTTAQADDSGAAASSTSAAASDGQPAVAASSVAAARRLLSAQKHTAGKHQMVRAGGKARPHALSGAGEEAKPGAAAAVSTPRPKAAAGVRTDKASAQPGKATAQQAKKGAASDTKASDSKAAAQGQDKQQAAKQQQALTTDVPARLLLEPAVADSSFLLKSDVAAKQALTTDVPARILLNPAGSSFQLKSDVAAQQQQAGQVEAALAAADDARQLREEAAAEQLRSAWEAQQNNYQLQQESAWVTHDSERQLEGLTGFEESSGLFDLPVEPPSPGHPDPPPPPSIPPPEPPPPFAPDPPPEQPPAPPSPPPPPDAPLPPDAPPDAPPPPQAPDPPGPDSPSPPPPPDSPEPPLSPPNNPPPPDSPPEPWQPWSPYPPNEPPSDPPQFPEPSFPDGKAELPAPEAPKAPEGSPAPDANIVNSPSDTPSPGVIVVAPASTSTPKWVPAVAVIAGVALIAMLGFAAVMAVQKRRRDYSIPEVEMASHAYDYSEPDRPAARRGGSSASGQARMYINPTPSSGPAHPASARTIHSSRTHW